MTDVGLRLNAYGGYHRNDITTLANVVVNCIIDNAEFSTRGINVEQGVDTMYPGPLDDMTTSIQPGELLFTRIGGPLQTVRGGLVPVFSSLNNILKKGDPKWKFWAKYRPFGWSATAARRDSTDKSPEHECVSRVGGTDTIVNGPYPIYKHDIIIVDIPDENNPRPRGSRDANGGKILAFPRPFRPETDSFDADTVREFLLKGKEHKRHGEEGSHALREGTQILKTALFSAGLAMLKALVEKGYATLAVGGASPAEDLLTLANSLGIPGTGDPLAARKVTEGGVQVDMGKFVMEHIVASAPDRMIIGRERDGHAPTGYRGHLYNAQRNIIENVNMGITKIQEQVRSRCIGRALMDIPPWKEGDVVAGSYAM